MARRRWRSLKASSIYFLLFVVFTGLQVVGCSNAPPPTVSTQAGAKTSVTSSPVTPAADSFALPVLPTDKELLASSIRLGRVVDLIQGWLNQTQIDKLPVYLPGWMLTGWAIAEQASHGQGPDNPSMWKTSRASSGALAAGYAVSFTDGINRVQLVANPEKDLTGLAWQESSVVSIGTKEPLKVAQVGETFYASLLNPEHMSVLVWGDASAKEQILEFARRLSQRALLGAAR